MVGTLKVSDHKVDIVSMKVVYHGKLHR
jgi:hypothetical protein